MTAQSNGNGAGGPAEAVPVLLPYRATRLDTVARERVEWLWSRRLPLGKIATLDGDPDVGKSTLCLDLAARITTGRPLPGEVVALVPAADVVLLAAEDGLGDTIRPRLEAAGADLERVHHFDAVPAYDEEGQVVAWVPPTLPDHIPALEQLVTATSAVLVIVDVLMAYLSGRADSHRDQDVRRALSPLVDMADRTGTCVVLLRHVPKSQRRGGQALAAGSGSMGIVGLARAGMVAAADPDDPDGLRKVLARVKGNLAPPWRSLTYLLRCSDCGRPACDDEAHGPARIDWVGESALSADQLLSEQDSDDHRSEVDEAIDWLRSMLADGPTPKAEIDPLARAEGIGSKALRTARQRLSVYVERDQSRRGRPSTWSLPDYVPSITSPPAGARNPQLPDQDESGSDGGYVPTLESGHVTGSEGDRACTRCGGPARDISGLCPTCLDPRKDAR